MTETIFTRRSIRKYKDEAVPREKIEQIINAAHVAPSAKNKQPWKFIVMTGNSRMGFLTAMEKGLEYAGSEDSNMPEMFSKGLPDAKNTLKIMKTAPVIIAAMYPTGKSPLGTINMGERISEILDIMSLGAAVENMLLEAESMGIGSLWIANTLYAYPALEAYLGEEGQLACAIAIGYPDENPKMRPRKPIEEIVEYRD